MAEENGTINYEEELKKVTAERDAYAAKLDEYIAENNKLNADLKVQQAINRKTVGVSDTPPKDDSKPKVGVLTAYRGLYKSKEDKK